jgi:alkylation response protein AidB-like acyl-CoA dehydrogenase
MAETAAQEPIVTGDELIARARALTPVLAAEAAESERLRRPTDAAIDALRESGIFRMMVPRAYGGYELDLDTFLGVGLALGAGDASLAWVANFYVEHNWIFCQFPEAFQKPFFAERDYSLAPATVAPTGVAEPVEGGYRLAGRWSWGTGVMHGDWVIVSAVVPGDDPVPDMRFFALPIEEITVDDVWHIEGMLGTGSNDILIDGRVIPEERAVSLNAMRDGRAPGAEIHDGPLYRTPMMPVLVMAAAMPAVGQARAVVDAFKQSLQDRFMPMWGITQAERPAAQMRVARAELEMRQTEMLMSEVVEDVMARRNEATLADRARWMASLALAVDQSKQIVASVATASGASAHFSSHPLQRAARDLSTLSCHAVFDLDARLETAGKAMLGLDPGPIMI